MHVEDGFTACTHASHVHPVLFVGEVRTCGVCAYILISLPCVRTRGKRDLHTYGSKSFRLCGCDGSSKGEVTCTCWQQVAGLVGHVVAVTNGSTTAKLLPVIGAAPCSAFPLIRLQAVTRGEGDNHTFLADECVGVTSGECHELRKREVGIGVIGKHVSVEEQARCHAVGESVHIFCEVAQVVSYILNVLGEVLAHRYQRLRAGFIVVLHIGRGADVSLSCIGYAVGVTKRLPVKPVGIVVVIVLGSKLTR